MDSKTLRRAGGGGGFYNARLSYERKHDYQLSAKRRSNEARPNLSKTHNIALSRETRLLGEKTNENRLSCGPTPPKAPGRLEAS